MNKARTDFHVSSRGDMRFREGAEKERKLSNKEKSLDVRMASFPNPGPRDHHSHLFLACIAIVVARICGMH